MSKPYLWFSQFFGLDSYWNTQNAFSLLTYSIIIQTLFWFVFMSMLFSRKQKSLGQYCCQPPVIFYGKKTQLSDTRFSSIWAIRLHGCRRPITHYQHQEGYKALQDNPTTWKGPTVVSHARLGKGCQELAWNQDKQLNHHFPNPTLSHMYCSYYWRQRRVNANKERRYFVFLFIFVQGNLLVQNRSTDNGNLTVPNCGIFSSEGVMMHVLFLALKNASSVLALLQEDCLWTTETRMGCRFVFQRTR